MPSYVLNVNGVDRPVTALGFDVVLASPGSRDQAAECGLDPRGVRPIEGARVAELLADRQVVVAQGQLANDVVLGLPSMPVVIDLYDPWLVENLHYAETLVSTPGATTTRPGSFSSRGAISSSAPRRSSGSSISASSPPSDGSTPSGWPPIRRSRA